jgi:hypothetical protein
MVVRSLQDRHFHWSVATFLRRNLRREDQIWSSRRMWRYYMLCTSTNSRAFPFWGAQAAGLLSSTACRRLPHVERTPYYRTFEELFGRLPKRTGWQPVLPGKRVRYPDPRIKMSSVCATFFEISNCDARSIFAERARIRRNGSDQNRIASRKAMRFPALSTIDP